MKRAFIFLSILFIFSCNNKPFNDKISDRKKHTQRQPIIYEIKKSVANAIFKQYKEYFVNNEVVYAWLNTYLDGKRTIFTNTNETNFYKFQLSNTNRFLKINDTIKIPVLFNADFELYKRNDRKLIKSCGGGRYFITDEEGEYLITRISM